MFQFLAPWYMLLVNTMLSRSVVPAVFRIAREYVKAQILCSEWPFVHFMSNI